LGCHAGIPQIPQVASRRPSPNPAGARRARRNGDPSHIRSHI